MRVQVCTISAKYSPEFGLGSCVETGGRVGIGFMCLKMIKWILAEENLNPLLLAQWVKHRGYPAKYRIR